MITQLHTFHYRNAPYGGWKRAIPADCDLQHVDWKAFEGEAKEYPFDPNRLINWRFFWDYSGGNVYENMVHQVGFWYKLLDLKIPQKVTMVGANYLSPDMQVPDTMDVAMIQREKLLFTWNSMFGNNLMGEGYDEVLGDKGTILRDESANVRFVPQEKKAAAPSLGEAPGKAPDIVGMSDISVLHMQNFFDCVRSRKETNCPLRSGIPLRRRLPHGRGVLPPRPNRELGRAEGRDCVDFADQRQPSAAGGFCAVCSSRVAKGNLRRVGQFQIGGIVDGQAGPLRRLDQRRGAHRAAGSTLDGLHRNPQDRPRVSHLASSQPPASLRYDDGV